MNLKNVVEKCSESTAWSKNPFKVASFCARSTIFNFRTVMKQHQLRYIVNAANKQNKNKQQCIQAEVPFQKPDLRLGGNTGRSAHTNKNLSRIFRNIFLLFLHVSKSSSIFFTIFQKFMIYLLALWGCLKIRLDFALLSVGLLALKGNMANLGLNLVIAHPLKSPWLPKK